MVIDSSAILAILLLETDALRLASAIEADTLRLISAPTVLECAMVIEAKFGREGANNLDLLLYKSGIDVVPFAAEHLAAARDASRRYGKGRHPASLNFGDCMAYALAKVSGEPLLFVGSDFTRTDVACAI
jgi:ribonuclease VapC